MNHPLILYKVELRVCSISLKNFYFPAGVEQMPAISRVFFLSNTLESVLIPPAFGMSPTLGTDSQVATATKGPQLRNTKVHTYSIH